jgi:hypothetical protein
MVRHRSSLISPALTICQFAMEPPDHELESITRTSLRVCYGKRQPRGRHGHVLRFLAASCSCAPSWNTLTHPSPAAAGTHPSASCWVIHINARGKVFSTAREAVTQCKNTAAVNRKYRAVYRDHRFCCVVISGLPTVFITAPQW